MNSYNYSNIHAAIFMLNEAPNEFTYLTTIYNEVR